MNPASGREPWHFASLSSRPDGGSFGLPLSARVAQSPPPLPPQIGSAPGTSSTSAVPKMKGNNDRGRRDPQDTNALLSLLDDGWYSRSSSSGLPALKTAKTAPTRPAPASSAGADSPTTSSSGFPRIPAVRPLNLASLRDHNGGGETPAMASARSIGAWRPSSTADTPRSFVTAASLAASLPQTSDEVDALPLEDVRSLAEEADALAAAAAKAAALAKARLRGVRGPAEGLSMLGQVVLQMYIIVLGVLSLALMVAEAVLGVAWQWRVSAAARVAVEKAQRAAFFAAGAVAGTLRALAAAPSPHSLT